MRELAARRSLRLVRLSFEDPHDLSPFAADLYRAWYADLGRPTSRLFAQCYMLIEPYWTLRTASVPFWLVFNGEPSAEALEKYLDQHEAYEDIHLTLFSNGIEHVGLAPIGRWRVILSHARRAGRFVGVEEGRYPFDFASIARFSPDAARMSGRYPLPEPLPLERVERFAAEGAGRYPVTWEETASPSTSNRVTHAGPASDSPSSS